MALPLVELGAFALVLWAVAMALAAALLMDKLASVFDGLPVIGGKIASLFKSAAQAITNAAGSLENGIDHLIGASWHALAGLTDSLWNEIKAHSGILAQYGGTLGRLLNFVLHLKALAGHAAHSATHGLSRIAGIERELGRLEKREKALAHEVAKGIGDDVLPRIKSLDKALHNITHKVIPGLRSDVAAAEGDVTALGEYVRAHYLANTEDAIAAATAVGLAALGLGGLRCDSNPFKNNRNACGLWGDLSTLLGLAAIPLEIASIYALIETAQEITPTVTGLASDLLQV